MLALNPTGKCVSQSHTNKSKYIRTETQDLKRILNLGDFLNRAKPYSNFKPGQTTLDRDYYAAATTEKPSGENCL